MSSIRKPARLAIVLSDRLRAALVTAFREGWQAKCRSDRDADFTAILKHWSEGLNEVIGMIQRRRGDE